MVKSARFRGVIALKMPNFAEISRWKFQILRWFRGENPKFRGKIYCSVTWLVWMVCVPTILTTIKNKMWFWFNLHVPRPRGCTVCRRVCPRQHRKGVVQIQSHECQQKRYPVLKRDGFLFLLEWGDDAKSSGFARLLVVLTRKQSMFWTVKSTSKWDQVVTTDNEWYYEGLSRMIS